MSLWIALIVWYGSERYVLLVNRSGWIWQEEGTQLFREVVEEDIRVSAFVFLVF